MVTCICVTRNRPEWLPKAIQCFLDQSYENRELLILNDGDDRIERFIPPDELASMRIHIPVIDKRCIGPTLGEKRNAACEAAGGEILAIWDDDDYSAPGRLEDQVRRIQDSGKAVTGYSSMKFTDGEKWYVFNKDGVAAGVGLGTSLCFLASWWEQYPFPAITVGEDSGFVHRAHVHKQFISAPAGDLMYGTIHPGNTSPRQLDKGYTLLN